MAPLEVDCEGRWRALSAEVLRGVKDWRLQSPQATRPERAAAVEARLAQCRARLRHDVAWASRAADLRQSTAPERPVCPPCGGPVEPRGPRARHLTTPQGPTLTRDRR